MAAVAAFTTVSAKTCEASHDPTHLRVSCSLRARGSYFSTERKILAPLCTRPRYVEAVHARLQSPEKDGLHESVVLALEKALAGGSMADTKSSQKTVKVAWAQKTQKVHHYETTPTFRLMQDNQR